MRCLGPGVQIAQDEVRTGADERARRRSMENDAAKAATAVDLARRDELDSTRAADPLRRADDAIVFDTTEFGIDEVVARLRKMLDKVTA